MRSALIAGGLAALASAALALPATATSGTATLYSGSNFSGVQTPVALDSHGCVNVVGPVRSGKNLSSAVIEVFYRVSCDDSGGFYVLGGLQQASFPLDGLSYRVR